MRQASEEFDPASVDEAKRFVRSAAEKGATAVWLEVWTGRTWELAYGSDPESVERHLDSSWDGRGRFRVRVPGETREPGA